MQQKTALLLAVALVAASDVEAASVSTDPPVGIGPFTYLSRFRFAEPTNIQSDVALIGELHDAIRQNAVDPDPNYPDALISALALDSLGRPLTPAERELLAYAVESGVTFEDSGCSNGSCEWDDPDIMRILVNPTFMPGPSTSQQTPMTVFEVFKHEVAHSYDITVERFYNVESVRADYDGDRFDHPQSVHHGIRFAHHGSQLDSFDRDAQMIVAFNEVRANMWALEGGRSGPVWTPEAVIAAAYDRTMTGYGTKLLSLHNSSGLFSLDSFSATDKLRVMDQYLFGLRATEADPPVRSADLFVATLDSLGLASPNVSAADRTARVSELETIIRNRRTVQNARAANRRPWPDFDPGADLVFIYPYNGHLPPPGTSPTGNQALIDIVTHGDLTAPGALDDFETKGVIVLESLRSASVGIGSEVRGEVKFSGMISLLTAAGYALSTAKTPEDMRIAFVGQLDQEITAAVAGLTDAELDELILEVAIWGLAGVVAPAFTLGSGAYLVSAGLIQRATQQLYLQELDAEWERIWNLPNTGPSQRLEILFDNVRPKNDLERLAFAEVIHPTAGVRRKLAIVNYLRARSIKDVNFDERDLDGVIADINTRTAWELRAEDWRVAARAAAGARMQELVQQRALEKTMREDGVLGAEALFQDTYESIRLEQRLIEMTARDVTGRRIGVTRLDPIVDIAFDRPGAPLVSPVDRVANYARVADELLRVLHEGRGERPPLSDEAKDRIFALNERFFSGLVDRYTDQELENALGVARALVDSLRDTTLPNGDPLITEEEADRLKSSRLLLQILQVVLMSEPSYRQTYRTHYESVNNLQTSACSPHLPPPPTYRCVDVGGGQYELVYDAEDEFADYQKAHDRVSVVVKAILDRVEGEKIGGVSKDVITRGIGAIGYGVLAGLDPSIANRSKLAKTFVGLASAAGAFCGPYATQCAVVFNKIAKLIVGKHDPRFLAYVNYRGQVIDQTGDAITVIEIPATGASQVYGVSRDGHQVWVDLHGNLWTGTQSGGQSVDGIPGLVAPVGNGFNLHQVPIDGLFYRLPEITNTSGGTQFPDYDGLILLGDDEDLLPIFSDGSGVTMVQAPSAISYERTWLVGLLDHPLPLGSLTPVVTGGRPTSFTISPALPQGLTLSPTTGEISGIPTVAGQASYTITAANDAGSATTELTIQVFPGFVVDSMIDAADAGGSGCVDVNGTCNLRAAVAEANKSGNLQVIVLPDRTLYLDEHLGEIYATTNLLIVGAGMDATVIDGDDATRFIRTTRTLHLGDLTIQRTVDQNGTGPNDGYGAAVGIIGNVPYLRMSHVRVAGNRHELIYTDGGAITIEQNRRRDANHEIEYSVFTGNYAAHRGGAIGCRHTGSRAGVLRLTVRHSTFAANESGGEGGALSASGKNCALTVESSEFSGNDSTVGYARSGGAIFIDGFVRHDTRISDSRFVGNKATEGSAVVDNSPRYLTLERSELIANEASSYAGVVLKNTSGSRLYLEDNLFLVNVHASSPIICAGAGSMRTRGGNRTDEPNHGCYFGPNDQTDMVLFPTYE